MSSQKLSITARSQTSSIRKPKELTSYSRTFDGEYVNDDSSLSYFFLPDADISTGIDLEAGFGKFKKSDESKDGDFDGLLSAIKKYEEEHGKLKCEIITWRGILTKLLTLPFNSRDPIYLNVVYFDGHIFIKENKLKRQLSEQKPTLEHEKMIYSGYKFEAIATIPKPLSQITRAALEKRSKKVVNNTEQYASVVRTGVGKTKIVVGAEVDCVWDYKPEDGNPLDHYVELKTTRTVNDARDSIRFERKLYKTWAQTYLLGINKIIYGYRDDRNMLQAVEQFTCEEIPNLLKSNPHNTNPHKINCMESLSWYGAVIEWLVNTVPKDENKAWELEYDVKEKSIILRQADEHATSQLLDSVVTKEFKDWRQQNKD